MMLSLKLWEACLTRWVCPSNKISQGGDGMSRFLISLNERSVASQVSDLVNSNNRLRRRLTIPSITQGRTNYFVEMSGMNIQTASKDKVVMGCIGMETIDQDTVMLKHLSIRNEFRRLGIASKLVHDALKSCKNKKTRMRIRADNKPSLYLAEKFGFKYIFHEDLGNYSVLTVERSVSNDI